MEIPKELIELADFFHDVWFMKIDDLPRIYLTLKDLRSRGILSDINIMEMLCHYTQFRFHNNRCYAMLGYFCVKELGLTFEGIRNENQQLKSLLSLLGAIDYEIEPFYYPLSYEDMLHYPGLNSADYFLLNDDVEKLKAKIDSRDYDPSKQTNNGSTFLQWAARCGAEKCFNYLLKTNVCRLDKKCLDMSVMSHNETIMNYILDQGFKIDLQNLDTAQRYRNYDFVNKYVKILGVEPDYQDSLRTFNLRGFLDQLKRVKNVNKLDNDGNSMLVESINSRYPLLTKYLLSLGADPNLEGEGEYPITATIQCPVTTDLLIEKGVKADGVNEDGLTGLHATVYNCDLKNTRILIERGANVNAKNKKGETPICYAVSKGDYEIVKLLIEKGANLNVMTGSLEKESLLRRACISLKDDYRILEILMKNGLRYEIRGNSIVLKRSLLMETLAAGNDKMSLFLLDFEKNLKRVDESGLPYIAYCLTGDCPLTLQKMLDRGMSLYFTSEDKTITTLSLCCSHRSAGKCLKVLKDNGFNLNAQTSDGYTPLHFCAKVNAPEQAQILLDMGVNPYIEDKDGNTPLMLACLGRGNINEENVEVIRVLLKNGININYQSKKLKRTALMVSSDMNTCKTCDILCRNGADTNLVDAEGKTAILIAAKYANPDLIKLLIKYGAKIDFKSRKGFTALSIAAIKQYPLCCKYLIEYGANANYIDRTGNAPIHHLILTKKKGDFKLSFKYMLESHKINWNLMNRNGEVPMVCALNTKNYDAFIDIMNQDARIDFVHDNISVLMWAYHNYNFKVIQKIFAKHKEYMEAEIHRILFE